MNDPDMMLTEALYVFLIFSSNVFAVIWSTFEFLPYKLSAEDVVARRRKASALMLSVEYILDHRYQGVRKW